MSWPSYFLTFALTAVAADPSATLVNHLWSGAHPSPAAASDALSAQPGRRLRYADDVLFEFRYRTPGWPELIVVGRPHVALLRVRQQHFA
jgi:hypothetical protein